MTERPASTLTLDAGGAPWTVDLGTPDETGEYPTAYTGNIYLSIDGQLYGSIYVRLNDAGEPIITLGQYDPQAQKWAPRNDLRPEDIE